MSASNQIYIENKGQEIHRTNYFDTDMSARGLIYLSWNSGAGRILLPDSQAAALSEMIKADSVIVSIGPWIENQGKPGIEILFEDYSSTPYAITIDLQQSDRALPLSDHGSEFYISVWTRQGQNIRLPATLRFVSFLPYLMPQNFYGREDSALRVETLLKRKAELITAHSNAFASFFIDGRLDATATERMTEEIWKIKQELKSLGIQE